MRRKPKTPAKLGSRLYNYDRFGNRNFDTANTTTIPTGCQAAQCNPTIDTTNNRFTTGQGYTYDLSGNLITDAQNRSFVYDAENKQKTVSDASSTIGTYFYDGDGKRVKKVSSAETTLFVYDASGKLAAEYLLTSATPQTPTTSYLTTDTLGSPRVITDQAGNVQSRRDFMPFGEELSRSNQVTDSTRQKFTGYERDNETSLDYALNRYHSSTLGRFTQADPYNIIFEKEKGRDEKERQQIFVIYISQPQIWNKYSYSVNNPLKFTDPDGRRPLTEQERKNIQNFIQSGMDYANSKISDAKERENFIAQVRNAATMIENAILAVPNDAKEDPRNLRAVLFAIGKIGDTEYNSDGTKYIDSNGARVTFGAGTNKCNLFVAAAYVLGANIGFNRAGNPGGYQLNSLGLINNKKKVDQSKADTKAHHDLARKVAAESIILLKNEKAILPLDKTQIKSLAVIGPNADIAQLGDRGSVYAPVSYTVSPLEGLKNKLGAAVKINYAKGYKITNFKTIPANFLQTPNGKKGLLSEFFTNKDFAGKPALTNFVEQLKFDWGATLPKEVSGGKTFTARYTGKLLAPAMKTVFLGIKSDGVAKLYVDDRLLIENIGTWTTAVDPNEIKFARIDLQSGKPREIRVEYERGKEQSAIELLWADAPQNPFAEAIYAAKNSDYAIIFAGLNIDYEGEGLDRFDMNLPDLQNELIAAVAKVNPRTIVIINSGTPNDLSEWIAKIPAVLQAWYLGIEGGSAIADILFGDANPSGKLPVTFSKRREDYADFSNSKVVGDKITYAESVFVGYRHFDEKQIAPLFPFGHGLSYTTFVYKDLQVEQRGETVEVSVEIKNAGKHTGAEIAQLYVGDSASSLPRPPKELKAFRKINLAPNETRRILFQLKKEDFSFYDPKRENWIFEAGEFGIFVGASAGDIRAQQKIEINKF